MYKYKYESKIANPDLSGSLKEKGNIFLPLPMTAGAEGEFVIPFFFVTKE